MKIFESLQSSIKNFQRDQLRYWRVILFKHKWSWHLKHTMAVYKYADYIVEHWDLFFVHIRRSRECPEIRHAVAHALSNVEYVGENS